jgi:hypothetical protein
MDYAPFKDGLADWTDFDVAQLRLCRALGLLGPEVNYVYEVKHVFWTENRLGGALEAILEQLVIIGALEIDRSGPSYRWNTTFDPMAVAGTDGG